MPESYTLVASAKGSARCKMGGSRLTAKERAYLEEHREELRAKMDRLDRSWRWFMGQDRESLLPYRGQWVAVRDCAIVLSSDTRGGARDDAREKGFSLSETLIVRVDDDGAPRLA